MNPWRKVEYVLMCIPYCLLVYYESESEYVYNILDTMRLMAV